MSIFANRLKLEREKKKEKNPIWTQGYVAKLLGVARTTYTAYENGTKQPPLETVNKLADFFEVNTDYLLGRTESKNREDDLEKALDDPDFEIFFKELKGSPEENRRKALEFLKFLNEQEKK